MDSTDLVLDKLATIGVRMSRRRLLKLASVSGLGVAGAAILAACGGDDDDGDEPTQAAATQPPGGAATQPPSSSATQPPASNATEPPAAATAPAGQSEGQSGGTWSMAIISNPTAYPITIPGALTDILVNKTIFNTLLRYDLDGDAIVVAPDLAESFEANDELSEYTFKLRQDVTWHDGEPFDADDVVFTINTILNPDVNARFRSTLSAVESIEKVDDYTVTFKLKFPYAPLPVMLGYNIAIVPQHLLEGQDLNEPTDFIANPIGTGPMKFKEYSSGSFLLTERNDDYFRGPAKLDGITYKIIPDVNTQVAQLQSGDLDFAVIEPAQVEVLENSGNVAVVNAPQVNYFFFALNHNVPLFQDKLVRQAMSYAIDKQAIIEEILQDTATIATGPISPLLAEYYNPDVPTYDYDPEKAAELLAEAGWVAGSDGILEKDGEKLAFVLETDKGNPTREQTVTFGQQQLQEIGMDVTIEFYERNIHLERYRPDKEYQALMEWWITPPDPDIFDHYHSTSTNNRWAYSNPDVDKLIEDGRKEPDPDKRAEIYKELQAVIADDAPIIYLYYPQEIQAISMRTKNFPFLGYRDALTHMEEVSIEE
ncbi:MAG: peptide-binding protein [Chloroflexota bacterium]|nr:peptide-binding protein [Chloroflexota bacterium]